MTFNMKGSSFFGKGNQSKSKHTPAKMDIGGIVKGVSGMMGKKDDAPTDYASPVKLTDAERKANLLKAVPNKEAYDKLSDADKKGFDATGAKVGLPTKPAKYASPAKGTVHTHPHPSEKPTEKVTGKLMATMTKNFKPAKKKETVAKYASPAKQNEKYLDRAQKKHDKLTTKIEKAEEKGKTKKAARLTKRRTRNFKKTNARIKAEG